MTKGGRGNKHRVGIQDFDEEWGHVFSQLNAKTNMISSELLSGLSVEEVSVVKQYVSEFDAKIVIYLRRHDHRLNSLVNQKIKGGKDIRKVQLNKPIFIFAEALWSIRECLTSYQNILTRVG